MRRGCRGLDAARGSKSPLQRLEHVLQASRRMHHLLVVTILSWAALLACDETSNRACGDPGTLHDEVIEVPASQFPSEAGACFSSHPDCSSLCDALARSRGTGGRVLVSGCDRVTGQDAATSTSGDIPDAGNSSDASRAVHLTYRTFLFCGS